MPFMLNPLPPPFGFILILIASAAPKQLLTHHFWSEYQTDLFAKEKALVKLRRQRKLLEKDIQGDANEALILASEALGVITHRAESQGLESGVSDALCEAFFQAFQDEGPLSLENLSRKHVTRLYHISFPSALHSKTSMFSEPPPTKPPRKSKAPRDTRRLCSELSAYATALAQDDATIFAEGIDFLTPGELREACLERGLLFRLHPQVTNSNSSSSVISMPETTYFVASSTHRREILSRWIFCQALLLDIASRLKVLVPPSLMLHLPLLLALGSLE